MSTVAYRFAASRRLRAALLASSALALASTLPAAGPAHAQDATWLASPGSGDFNTGANWSTGAVPTGTAFFDASAATSLTFSSATSLGGWTFNAGAPAYSFANGGTLSFTGTGIDIQGGSATITNSGTLHFFNTSTAGSAAITNDDETYFRNGASAGSASITNNSVLYFFHTSTAGGATITNNAGGILEFSNTSTAGNATITNNNFLYFNDTSTAGSATIGNSGTLYFSDNSTAGSATITNNGGVNFYNTSTAGSATITNNNSGTLTFGDTSTAGNATITNNSGGTLNFNATSTAGNATITNNWGVNFSDTSTAGSATITNNDGLYFYNASTAGSATITNSGTLDFYNTSTAGNASITNNGEIGFYDTSTAGGATITNNLVLTFANNSTAGGANIINNLGGTVDFSYTTGPNGDHRISAGSIDGGGTFKLGANELTVGANNRSTNVSGAIADGGFGGGTGGSLVKTGTGTLTLSGTNTYTGGTTINGGTLAVSSDGNLGAAAGGLSFSGGTLQFLAAGFTSNRAVTLNAGGGTFDTGANAATLAGVVSGAGGLTKTGVGTLTLSGVNAYTGGTTINAGTLAGGAANAFSAASATAINAGGTLDLGGFAQTINAVALSSGTIRNGTLTGAIASTGGTVSDIGGSATLTIASGVTTVLGSNSYTDATTVNGGTLTVNGTSANSSVTVNSGGTLGGTGTVGNTTIASGGALAPGNSIGTLTVSGNLTFNAGGFYTVEVSPTAADRTNVTGTVTLTGATVQAVALAGSFRQQTYTILNATGGFGGTQFAGLTGSSFAPGARNPHLTYDTNNVYLVLDPGTLQLSSSASGNQTKVAGAINNFVENGGTPPAAFDVLLNMSNAQLTNALNQVSGQPGAGSTQASFGATQQFMAMLDPASGHGGGPGAISFAEEDEALGYAAVSKRDAKAREAYAAVTPRDRRTDRFEQRWGVWASGYGGASTVSGNTSSGTSTTTSRVYGTVVGADYRFSPDTVIGFALGGAGYSFSLSDGLGSGRADLFQAGLYGRHSFGAAYLSASFTYGWQDVTTDRTVTVSGTDKLTANYKASTFAARAEAGWRFAPWPAFGFGVTPYAALQVTSFHLPSYSESATSGSGTFALSYNAQTTTNVRSELGVRFDKPILLDEGLFTLRGRLAWAHDSNTDRPVTAAFQTLPGSTFTVNGAQPAADAALVSAGAEMQWLNGFSLAGTFEGEFSNTTQSYAGKGTLRYAW